VKCEKLIIDFQRLLKENEKDNFDIFRSFYLNFNVSKTQKYPV
jgi:hypothetical protein